MAQQENRLGWGFLKVPVLVAVISGLVIGGAFIGFRQMQRQRDERGIGRPEMQMARSTARLIQELGPFAVGQGLLPQRDIDFFNDERIPTYFLINRNLAIIGSPGTENGVAENDSADRIPVKIGEFPSEPNTVIEGNYPRAGTQETYAIVRLETPRELYLFYPRVSRMKAERDNRFWMLARVGIVGAAILSALSVLLLLIYLRIQARQAYRVMAELSAGKIKTRFHLNRFDELGQLMQQFNRMADELEKLMIRTKEMERARSRWLQELAHDLRTPLATIDLGNALLQENWEKLAEDKKREVVRGNAGEIHYIKNLVEDLLFLSLLEDPDYFSQKQRFDLIAAFRQEAEGYREKAKLRGLEFLFRAPAGGKGIWLEENPQLFKRLIRNTLDNALAAAQTEVEVEVRQSEGEGEDGLKRLFISIKNDTKSGATEWIENYGKKRESRDGAASLGLGSRIVVDILKRLRGKFRIRVEPIENSQSFQAHFEMKIPLL